MDNFPVEIMPTPEISKAEKVAAVVALAEEIGEHQKVGGILLSPRILTAPDEPAEVRKP